MVMERTLQIENTRHGQERLTIGQIALRSGINAKAIRYYESIGLLQKASRSANGYRSFSQADLNRLILLRRLRLLGVSLDRLAPLLRAASDVQCTEVQQEVLRLIAERLAVIDEEMKELGLLREQVQDYQRHLRACAPDSAEAFQDCRDLSCLALPSETPSSEEETHDALSNAR